MSTSVVHILTIVGKASLEVEAACDELLNRRIPKPREYGSDDWSAQDHANLATLGKSLIAAAYELPVIFYSQYIDAWTVADARFSLVRWPDGKRRQIYGSSHGMVFYPSSMVSDFLSQIKSYRSTNLYQKHSEDRCYLDRLAEAIEAPLWLKAPFIVVGISQAIGASRLDDEIRAALEMPIRLCDIK